MKNRLKSVELFLVLSVATTIGVSIAPIINAEEIESSPATTQL